MQCAYLNYLIKRNHVHAVKLEEDAHMSASTISRIKNGKLEVPDEEFAILVHAAGGDMKGYDAFCSALDASPNVVTQSPGDPPITISTVRQFYVAQIAEIEARYMAEIARMCECHEKEIQRIERMHEREIERIESILKTK